MSQPYFKLKHEDEVIIRRYLATTPDVSVDFAGMMFCKWGQRWLVKEEVEERLHQSKLGFRNSARTVAIAMCLTKAYGTNFGKRFLDQEKEGCYFVKRIFRPFADAPAEAGNRTPDFYDSAFWASPVVMVWIVNAIDAWFEYDVPNNSFFAFVAEQADEILGPHPHTDPDYP